ncbi:hypothetical protein BLOT_007509 [Blomia tropicalis]|nr:hypothetical protein BLOT_007509 [Blomia tropicalis]
MIEIKHQFNEIVPPKISTPIRINQKSVSLDIFVRDRKEDWYLKIIALNMLDQQVLNNEWIAPQAH